MKIPVLIESTADQRFRATGGSPLQSSVEADTPDEAVAKLREVLQERVSHGAQITSIEVGTDGEAWMAGAGMFRDDPLYIDWRQAVGEYRRQVDQATDRP